MITGGDLRQSRLDVGYKTFTISPWGEMYVVPKGIEHKTSAETVVKMMMIEPCGVLNTGHEGGERTAENDIWI